MTFVITFIALFAAHQFGDHWGQAHRDALGKGAPGHAGRLRCLSHVADLTVYKAGFLTMAVLATGATLPNLWTVAAILGLDAASHYWADRAASHPGKKGRRVTLEALADVVGKTEFWNLGKTVVDADGNPAPHMGTGAYALDQSFHVFMIFIASFFMGVLS